MKYAALALLGLASAETCPNPTSIQTDRVKNEFNMDYFHGDFYEIAYHDYTQPIGVCGCQRSVKSFDKTNNKIKDEFTLNCGSETDNTKSHTYHNHLSFDLTDKPGVW